MYHRCISDAWKHPEFVRFLRTYINHSMLEKLISIVLDDSFIKDYNIFESVSDFTCKDRVVDRIVVRSGGRYSSIEYYDLEFTPDHRFYYAMMKGWTFDLNKYVMSKFDGNWFRIPKNKYTLTG